MLKALTICAVSLSLAACSQARSRNNSILFDGQAFKARASKVEARNQFAVSVSPVSASVQGAREAARYAGIRYCIANYGSSDIYWVLGPDVPASSLQVEDNTAYFRGDCAYD